MCNCRRNSQFCWPPFPFFGCCRNNRWDGQREDRREERRENRWENRCEERHENRRDDRREERRNECGCDRK